MARVLVTGATGFIGRRLLHALIARRDEVTCLVRSANALNNFPANQLRRIIGDVCNPETVRAAVADHDVVYHLAGSIKALRRADFHATNETGAGNVARACVAFETPPTLIQVSSLAAAGPSTAEVARVECDSPAPVSHYGWSKLAGERASRAFADRVPVTFVRPPIVFGPNDTGMFPIFRMLRRRNLHLVPGFRTACFSLIHVDDLAAGLIRAAEMGERARHDDDASGAYFLASPERPSYSELGRMIGKAVGRENPRVMRAPKFLGWVVAGAGSLYYQVTRTPAIISIDKMREGAAGSWTCSVEKAARDQVLPEIPPLQQRLNETAEAYFAAGWLRRMPH